MPRSIVEIWGERVTRSLVLRMLCGAWLVPAASLIWIGLAASGLRRTSEASQVLALGRTQATAVLLAVFTVLVGASVFVRQASLVSEPEPGCRGPFGRRPNGEPIGRQVPGPRCHVLGLIVGLPVALVGVAFEATGPVLLPIAAFCGFVAGLGVARALVRNGVGRSVPLAALMAGIAFQLTMGWLHLAHPSAAAAPLLVVEGLLLAWAAAAAARTDPFAVPVVVVTPRPVTAELVGSTATFSRASAQPSIPEAVVGR